MKNKCIVKKCQREYIIPKHKLCAAHLRRYYRVGYAGEDEIPTRKKHVPYWAIPVKNKEK